jgi:hypothetical protein
VRVAALRAHYSNPNYVDEEDEEEATTADGGSQNQDALAGASAIVQ